MMEDCEEIRIWVSDWYTNPHRELDRASPNSRLSMLQKLQQLETTKDVAWKWQSVYTGIVIISNRATPAHWDSKGRPEWFDLLLNYSSMCHRGENMSSNVAAVATLPESVRNQVG